MTSVKNTEAPILSMTLVREGLLGERFLSLLRVKTIYFDPLPGGGLQICEETKSAAVG